MDVSPETIRTVEFRERLRGYNQDDVDQFLERMAAGVEILQQRLREANERAARAEREMAEAGEGEEALRRTLVLAQRTADLAVEEARDQAARTLEAAHGQAQVIIAEAEEQARRLAQEAHAQVWADLGRLEAARDQLRQDVAALERYLLEERARAQAALTEAARQLAEAVPGLAPPPAGHEHDLGAIRSWTPTAPAAGTVSDQAERSRDPVSIESVPSDLPPEPLPTDLPEIPPEPAVEAGPAPAVTREPAPRPEAPVLDDGGPLPSDLSVAPDGVEGPQRRPPGGRDVTLEPAGFEDAPQP